MSDTDQTSTRISWECALASLLTDLLDVQQDTLEFLAHKRDLLAEGNAAALSQHEHLESGLIQRLRICHDRRQELLQQAAEHGMPSESLKHLAGALEKGQRESISPILTKASSQARLLRHHSLANWVLAQRTLLHISHLIEILATGGKGQPTYGKGAVASNGALVDRAV